LDLTDFCQVQAFFESNHIDYVVHSALFRSSIPDDPIELDKNLRMFYALAAQSHRFKKMIYFGSGAEFDKSRNIVRASETEITEHLPYNRYGLGKYIMNQYAIKSRNIYNFRLFGTLNPYERYTKNVVANMCVKAIKHLPLTLNQDCLFSWVDIDDVISFIGYAFHHKLKYHDYNLTLERPYSLGNLATRINEMNGAKLPIIFKQPGFNKEYTAQCERWMSEYSGAKTPIEESLRKVYDKMEELLQTLDVNMTDIDARWNTRPSANAIGGG
jgi:GDP-L-fucose synthase